MMGRKPKFKHTLLAKKLNDERFISYILQSNNHDNQIVTYFKPFKEYSYSDWTPQYVLKKLQLLLDGDIQFALVVDTNTIIYKSCTRNREYTIIKQDDKWVCECIGYSTWIAGASKTKCHHLRELETFLNTFNLY